MQEMRALKRTEVLNRKKRMRSHISMIRQFGRIASRLVQQIVSVATFHSRFDVCKCTRLQCDLALVHDRVIRHLVSLFFF